jgi:UDP-N-acetylmuramoyl-L-alanyl-D-glutamate--2,6-diaminopimelate ligase
MGDPETRPAGQTIRIRNIPFKVVGVLESKGFNLFGQDQDDVVIVPYTSHMKRLSRRTNVNSIMIQAATPDAIERALAAVRPFTKGRIILVFGCGGDRDRGKRAEMGRVAEAGADAVIITNDNPRTENPEQILDEIEQGMSRGRHIRITKRKAAIAHALGEARNGDVVLLAGKGHETYQIVGKELFPFDDREVIRDYYRDNH